MKKLLLCKIALVTLIGFSVIACEKLGEVVVEERTATGFVGIIANGAADVNVHPDNDFKVTVKTEENNLEKIVTEVRDGILYIEEKGLRRARKLTVDVYMPEFNTITIKGTGDVKVNNGSAPDLEINISGSGDIDARNYQVENVNITIKGSGDTRIWVTEALTGTMSGSGDVRYKGNPRINVKVTGSGDLRQL
jgi:hypothetical protein